MFGRLSFTFSSRIELKLKIFIKTHFMFCFAHYTESVHAVQMLCPGLKRDKEVMEVLAMGKCIASTL